MERKVRLLCPECGSDSITCDAVARWSVEAQDWVMSSLSEDGIVTCDDCLAEFEEGTEEFVE